MTVKEMFVLMSVLVNAMRTKKREAAQAVLRDMEAEFSYMEESYRWGVEEFDRVQKARDEDGETIRTLRCRIRDLEDVNGEQSRRIISLQDEISRMSSPVSSLRADLQVRTEWLRNNKIEAIKLLRLARDIGLKEAKEMVERHIEATRDVSDWTSFVYAVDPVFGLEKSETFLRARNSVNARLVVV